VSSARAFARPAPALTPSKNPHPRGALRALLTAAKVSPTARSIAAALWTYCDPFGRCYPSQRTLARLTGRCERTVRASVKELERAGVLLRDVPRLTERRRSRRTTVYRFTVGAWREQPPPPPPRREAPPVEPRELVGQVPDLEAADDAPAVEFEVLEAPLVAAEVCDAIAVTEREPAPVAVAVTEARDEAPVTELDAPGPLLGFVGWTLVDVPLEERPAAPPASRAARSPATTAARRPQGMNIPPTPNAPRAQPRTGGGWSSTRPGVARVPMPAALARAVARVEALARARTG
jgi:DNA-binding Lrp family transcriptional regulator